MLKTHLRAQRGGARISVVLEVLIALVALVFCGYWFLAATCYQYSGANQQAAQENAETYAAELGLVLTGVACVEHGTDQDGYVSCTLRLEGGVIENVECAGKSAFVDNHGCRQPKLSVGLRRGGGE